MASPAKASSMSRSLWPTGVESKGEKVATPIATRSESLAIDFCQLVTDAFVRKGYTDQQAAAALQTNYKVFQKAMSTAPNYAAYNPIMKRLGQIPGDVLFEFTSLLAERVGLAVGVESERAAAALEFANAAMRLMKAEQR